MTSAQERVWELYTLKQEIEAQLSDVKMQLDQAQADAYEEGIRTLDNGYRIVRSEIRDVSVKKFGDKYPELYQSAIETKIRDYKPDLTKTDIKNAIKGAVQTEEEQDAILADIENGIVQYRFALKKPLDPNPGRNVE